MNNLNKKHILPVSLLALGGGLVFSAAASALTETDDVTVRTAIQPYLAIEVGVDRGPTFDKVFDFGTLTPTDAGTFASDKLVTRVYTNSGQGYQLKLQDEDAENAMTQADPSVVSKISALSSTVTGVNNLGTGFPTNSWGYSVGEFSGSNTLDFSGVPTINEAAATLKQTTTLPTDGHDDTTTTFGVKADLGLTAGVYEDKIVFTASINLDDPDLPDAPDKEAFYTITKMQEMTPAVCASVATPSASETSVPQTTLTDERDGKSYTVRKLADGNCWMSGYMAYDLKPGDTFSPADTDVAGDWTAAGAGVTIVGNVTSGAWPDDNGLRYYGQSQAKGNLYNWNAATLGSAKGMGTGTAPASICPAGWHIPTQPSLQSLFGTAYGMAAKHGDEDFGTFFGSEQPDNADVALIKNVIGLTPTDYWTGTELATGSNTDITMLWTSTMGGMLGDGPLSMLFQPHQVNEAAHMLSTDNPATSDTAYADGYAVRCVAK